MPYSNRPLLWLLSTIVKQLLLFFADLAPIFANSPTAWMVERLWTRSDKKLCMLWKNWAINYSLLDSFFFKNDTACFKNLVIYGLHLGFMKQICEKHQQPFQNIFFDVFYGEYDELSFQSRKKNLLNLMQSILLKFGHNIRLFNLQNSGCLRIMLIIMELRIGKIMAVVKILSPFE